MTARLDGVRPMGAANGDTSVANENGPLVWVMLGNRAGDNNQMMALAEALGYRFELKPLRYNQLRRLPFLRGPRLVSLRGKARRLIVPPWPDLVIGAGYGSVPVARYIRKMNGGRTRIVQFGNPRTSIDDLDLVITTPQYGRPPAGNVLPLPFPVGNPSEDIKADSEEAHWLSLYPRPRRLIAVGGPTRNWEIDRQELAKAIELAIGRSRQDGGSVIVASSPRTPPRLLEWLLDRLEPRRIPVVDEFPRFGVVLAGCDEFLVTADSVSMVSEAILTGKPVGIVPIRKSLRGRISYSLSDLGLKPRTRIDLPKFWDMLKRRGLAGTPERPVASSAADTLAAAVRAIRPLLGETGPDRPALLRPTRRERPGPSSIARSGPRTRRAART